MALLGYPEHMLDEQGNPKPGVTGPSPASMGLLSAGLGMLSSPSHSRLPGDMSGIGSGAMQGLQAYQQRLAQIQQQRKDYNQSLMQAQNQEMAKKRFGLEMGEAKRIEARRQQMVSELPNLLEQIRTLPIPGIDQQIASIQAMAKAGAPEKAYQAAVNIIGQKLPQKHDVQHVMIPDTNVGYFIDQTTGEFKGQFSTAATKNYGTNLSGDDAVEFMTSKDPKFKLDGPSSNLVVQRNPDGSYKGHKYIKGNIGGTNEFQLKFGERLLEKYDNHAVVKETDKAITSYLALEKLGNTDPSQPGKMGVADMAIIFGFMKTLDPTSVVRESEYKTAAGVGIGLPEKLVRGYFSAKEGDILLDETRDEILRVAKDALLAKSGHMDNIRKNYIERSAQLMKISPDSEDLSVLFRDPYSSLREETTTPPPKPELPQSSDDEAAKTAAEIAASLNLVSNKPEPKVKRKILRNNAGRVHQVSVLDGDGASTILQAAGIKYSEDNIKALIKANKSRFNKNRDLIKSGGHLIIPKSIRQP